VSLIVNLFNKKLIQNPLVLPFLVLSVFTVYGETQNPGASFVNSAINNPNLALPNPVRTWLNNNYFNIVALIIFSPALAGIPSKRFGMATVLALAWIFFTPTSTALMYAGQAACFFLFFATTNKFIRTLSIILFLMLLMLYTPAVASCSHGHCGFILGSTDKNGEYCYEGAIVSQSVSGKWFKCGNNLHKKQCCCGGLNSTEISIPAGITAAGPCIKVVL